MTIDRTFALVQFGLLAKMFSLEELYSEKKKGILGCLNDLHSFSPFTKQVRLYKTEEIALNRIFIFFIGIMYTIEIAKILNQSKRTKTSKRLKELVSGELGINNVNGSEERKLDEIVNPERWTLIMDAARELRNRNKLLMLIGQIIYYMKIQDDSIESD